MSLTFILVNLLDAGYSNAKNKPKTRTFSSLFSDLSSNCLPPTPKTPLKKNITCKGVGKYNFQISYSDSKYYLSVTHLSKSKTEIFPKIMLQDSHHLKTNKIEWRTAHGKPFAILIPALKWDETGGKIIRSHLAVRGLVGFEFISYSLQSKNMVIASKKARQLLDYEYKFRTTKKESR